MPELPEVEGARLRLQPLVVGYKIERLDVRDPKLWRATEGLDAEAVAGLRTLSLTRRAKILRFELERGLTLLLHLKIAGQIAFRFAAGGGFIGGHPYPLPQADLPDTSTRFTLYLDSGDTLFLNDQRRFAWLRLLTSEAADEFIAGHKFGPDPLDVTFTPEVLLARLHARKGRPVKAALLDQTCITGLGNIYADESLHGANLHPMMRAGDVTPQQAAALYEAIRAVLELAVPVGGAYVVNGRAATPPEQMERDFLRAHGRAGLVCPDCGPPETLIRRDFLAGRGTYWCVTCQPAPVGFVIPTVPAVPTASISEEGADAAE